METWPARRTSPILVCPFLLAASVGFVSARAVQQQAAPNFKIVAHFGAGSTGLRSWEATISGDGSAKLAYWDLDQKKEVTIAAHLEEADVKKLRDAIERSGFYDLRPSYAAKVDDEMTQRLTIALSGKSHTVSIYGLSRLWDDRDVDKFMKLWMEVLRRLPDPISRMREDLETPMTAGRPVEAEMDEIRELVLRDSLVKIRAHKGIYFISFEENKQPSRDFLKRLGDLELDLRPSSRFVLDIRSKSGFAVRDRTTGAGGVVLSVRRIRKLDEGTAEVVFLYYSGPEASSEEALRVVKSEGKWKIVERRRLRQSSFDPARNRRYLGSPSEQLGWNERLAPCRTRTMPLAYLARRRARLSLMPHYAPSPTLS
ncbi:hypothetical protein [Aquisphaera giovannonii]|uniref:hypothetical protein n=1 Tax=Aquisphaera giovannonii TaxID=406548 RepID=UPI001AEFF46F|nr:hypothetical protein [Aquisphaera giovannonii]